MNAIPATVVPVAPYRPLHLHVTRVLSTDPSAETRTVPRPHSPQIDQSLRAQLVSVETSAAAPAAVAWGKLAGTVQDIVAAFRPVLPLLLILGGVNGVNGQGLSQILNDMLKDIKELNTTSRSHAQHLARHDQNLTDIVAHQNTQDATLSTLATQIAQLTTSETESHPSEGGVRIGGTHLDYSTLALAAVVLVLVVAVVVLYREATQAKKALDVMTSPVITKALETHATQITQGREALDRFSREYQSRRGTHGFVTPLGKEPVEPPALRTLRDTLSEIDRIAVKPSRERTVTDLSVLQNHFETLERLLKDAHSLSSSGVVVVHAQQV